MPPNPATVNRPVPEHQLIEVRVRHINQLFNTIDPSPFHERDLDPAAEEFIEGWATEVPRTKPLAMRVHVEDGPTDEHDDPIVGQAVQGFFGRKAYMTRRRLRDLFRRGRISLVIGLAFLVGLGSFANALEGATGDALGGIVREGLLIGGWVAMWRPLEIFLYDWWPIRARARVLERLAAMPVTIHHRDPVR